VSERLFVPEQLVFEYDLLVCRRCDEVFHPDSSPNMEWCWRCDEAETDLIRDAIN
jgi:hypothetical protein